MDHYAEQMITESERSENSQKDDSDNIDTTHLNHNVDEKVDDDNSEETICSDCDEHTRNNPNSGFILACESPHSLVWAKHQYQFYRPAKVMWATFKENEDALLSVRFFGDHVEATVSVSECYLFSVERPDDTEVSDPDIYNAAIKVTLIIICFNQTKHSPIFLIISRKSINTLAYYEENLVAFIFGQIVLVLIRSKWAAIQSKW